MQTQVRQPDVFTLDSKVKTLHSFWAGFYRRPTQKPEEKESLNLESL